MEPFMGWLRMAVGKGGQARRRCGPMMILLMRWRCASEAASITDASQIEVGLLQDRKAVQSIKVSRDVVDVTRTEDRRKSKARWVP